MLSSELLKKAQCFLPANISALAKNLQVFPNWIEGGKKFTYNSYIVDVAARTKKLYSAPAEKAQAEPTPPSKCFNAMQAWGIVPAIPADRLRSPNGKWDLTTKNHNIYLTDNDTGKTHFLTTDGKKLYDWAGSPDCNLTQITNQRAGTIAPPIAIWSEDSNKILTHKVDQREVKELYLL
jgi:hypothetical protein